MVELELTTDFANENKKRDFWCRCVARRSGFAKFELTGIALAISPVSEEEMGRAEVSGNSHK